MTKILCNQLLCLLSSVLIIIIIPLNNISLAEDSHWKEVKPTKDGTQAWDTNSLVRKNDDLITIKTIFTPRANQILKVQPIKYTMEINCKSKEFKDLVVNNITNDHASWIEPQGDKLINEIIKDACLSNQ